MCKAQQRRRKKKKRGDGIIVTTGPGKGNNLLSVTALAKGGKGKGTEKEGHYGELYFVAGFRRISSSLIRGGKGSGEGGVVGRRIMVLILSAPSIPAIGT